MPFWRRPELSEHSEGVLAVPEDAGETAIKAINAFNAGDFSRCRALLRELGAPGTAVADVAVARDLSRRLHMDPVLLGIAAVSLLVLVFLAIWSVMVSH
jgi:hypothetical protein